MRGMRSQETEPLLGKSPTCRELSIWMARAWHHCGHSGKRAMEYCKPKLSSEICLAKGPLLSYAPYMNNVASAVKSQPNHYQGQYGSSCC